MSKTKRVLILFTTTNPRLARRKRSPYDFIESLELAADRDGIDVEFSFYNQLEFCIHGGEATVYDRKNKRDLREYDFVYFRKWSSQAEEALACTIYLKYHQIPFIETEVAYARPQSKFTQYFTFWAAGIPVPDTLYSAPYHLLGTFEKHQTDFKFPIIVKKRVSRKGYDNHLVKTKTGLKKLLVDNPEAEFLIQNFIPNDCDYRVFVCGYDIALIVKRTRQSDDTHLNNYSAGARGDLVDIKTADASLKSDAIAAAKSLHREVAGVDVMIDLETGKHYILEANKSPQINTMVFGEEHTHGMRDYLVKRLRG